MGGYEEHQKLRTKAVRLCKKKAYADAIKTLYAGAESLLKQKEQGSGCDLALYMIEIYGIAETPVNDESRGEHVLLLLLLLAAARAAHSGVHSRRCLARELEVEIMRGW